MLAEHAWERKFGEPLPTLADVMNEASQDDDDYVHIGYGKYKEKNMVDDPQAPTYSKIQQEHLYKIKKMIRKIQKVVMKKKLLREQV